EAEAAEAIEAIDIEFEPLPFVVDPIESLRPGGANARAQGNVWVRPAPAPAPARGAAPEGRGGRGRGAAGAPPPPQIQVLKWTDEDFRNAGDGQMPLGKATDEWQFGNVEEGLKKADLILDETFMTQSTGHQPLETRTAMAYWQNGKLYLHGSTQSTVQTVASVARWVGVPPAQVVMISEYTGGGFGSK
ncbi:MAG: xanthine dehydrogenase family protein molybdopterin-binding subunit, partial [Acidobacteria bacterium]